MTLPPKATAPLPPFDRALPLASPVETFQAELLDESLTMPDVPAETVLAFRPLSDDLPAEPVAVILPVDVCVFAACDSLNPPLTAVTLPLMLLPTLMLVVPAVDATGGLLPPAKAEAAKRE